MDRDAPLEVTSLLKAWAGGDTGALERLTPLVYEELRRLAGHYMAKERQGNSLQATALVNEAFLRLVKIDHIPWQDRAHFFAVSAQLMRRILVDAARARASEKRGGAAVKLDLHESIDAMPDRPAQMVALDEALDALASIDPRKAKVVELRFFGGLSVEETAEVLKISAASVLRDWKLARAWLMRELAG
ncbi:MAG TPA: sigma-70 family RNA polymerase sigma factor [Bryobacteraceae bacterium]|nr:sigma-70 family RNA polymerase sigma factor [Bryobacteraceae bacterium]